MLLRMQAAFSKLYYVLYSNFKETPSLAVLHRIGGQLLERFWSTDSCLKMEARQTNKHTCGEKDLAAFHSDV